MTRTVTVDGQEIRYELERKEVRNLNLRVRPDGAVYVSANPSVSVDAVDAFVTRRGGWILQQRRKFAESAVAAPQRRYVSGETFYILGRGLRLLVTKGASNRVESDGVYLRLEVKDPNDCAQKQRCVTRYLDGRSREIFGEILEEFYPLVQKYGAPRPVLRLREMKTRWGSCLAEKGVITLNKRLIEAPRNCVEYVIVHELCHLVYPEHSARFYRFLSMFLSDWKDRKMTLDKDYAHSE